MNIIKESFIYKMLISIAFWIEEKVKDSGLYAIFTKENISQNENSFFEKIIYSLISFFRKIFKKLKLDKAFKDSIFSKTYIWIACTIALAPLLETMQILALVMATILSFLLKILLEENFKFRYTPINIWVVCFVIIYALSAINSFSVATSLKIALLIISFILFYFVIINSIENEKQLENMVKILVAVGLIVAIYGIYQYLFDGGFDSSLYVDKEKFEDIGARVSGTFDNPNVMGEYLLLIIPLAMTYFFKSNKLIKKVLACFITFIIIISLFLTYSRGCYLGLIACFGIFFILVNFKFIILFIAGILALPFVLPSSVMNRFLSIGDTKESSTSYRISIWKGAFDMIKDFWYRPIGQGAKAFNNIYPFYAYSGVAAEHSHNLFLQLIIETGIVGIASFIVIIFKFYQALGHGLKISKDKNLSILIIAFISGMTGFLIQSLFDNTWYNNKMILIFWIFIALAMVTKNLVIVSNKNKREGN